MTRKALLRGAIAFLIVVGVTIAEIGHHQAPSRQPVIIAVGDSYAVGYQPNDPSGSATAHGFVRQLAKLLNRRHPATVLNFACSGATTETVLTTLGCTTGPPANNAPTYLTSQADAAVASVAAHRGQVKAVVVALGVNDFARCAGSSLVSQCNERLAPHLTARLRHLLQRLRRAAGTQVPIVGITYPNVGLIAWKSAPPNRVQAIQAQQLLATVINPAIISAYRGLGQVVDVTRASGGFSPLPLTVSGADPTSVATLCAITWMCREGDPHLTNTGQAFVARLIADQLLEHHG